MREFISFRCQDLREHNRAGRVSSEASRRAILLPASPLRGRVSFGVLVAAFIAVLALIKYGTTSWTNRPTGVSVDGYELSMTEFKAAMVEVKQIVRSAHPRDASGSISVTTSNPLSTKVKSFYEELVLSEKRFVASGTYAEFLRSMPGEFDTTEKRKAGRAAANDHYGTIIKHSDEQISILMRLLGFLMQTFSLNEAPTMGRLIRSQELRDTALAVKERYSALFDFLDKTQPRMDAAREYVFPIPEQEAEFKALSSRLDDALKAHRLQERIGLDFEEVSLIDFFESYVSE